jgi:hypothetical protein
VTARPRVDRDPVELPALAGSLAAVWEALCRLADALGDLPWTIVGGQMVFLHAAEHDVDVHRISADIDAAVDVRADPAGLKKLTAVLADLGFESCGESPEGHAHRFEKRTEPGVGMFDISVDPDDVVVQVDVLVPEGLGVRTDLRTVAAGTAFPAPAVSQALARSELVPVRSAGVVYWVPRPSLLGAIVGKATAAIVDPRDPERHLSDLAFLCGLVADPFALAKRSPRRTGRGSGGQAPNWVQTTGRGCRRPAQSTPS